MARSRSPGLDPKSEEQRLARKARRHADRRAAIMGAAIRLLAAQGTESFTVSAVAAVAGVSKPAVYYYFDSKEELLAALVADILEAETRALRAATAPASDALDALVRAVHALVEHHAGDLDRYRVAYLWPHVFGIAEHLTQTSARVEREQLDADLARRLAEDPALDPVGTGHPRALVTTAFATAHGLLTAACAAQPHAIPLDELGPVIDTLLRRGFGERRTR
jgi:AcrR family transcriptional regulator